MALTDNLQAYYKLDGNSNSETSSGTGSDTSVTYSSGNGIIPQGAGMNGSSSYISVAANAAFQPSGSFTLNAWIYVNSYRGDYTGWVGKFDETGNDRAYCIAEFTGGTQCIAFTYNADSTASANVVYTRPATGGWHMHTMVFTTSSKNVVYLDGVYQGEASASFASVDTAADPFKMGGNLEVGGAVNYANIRVDEVGLWHRALDSTEITTLYNSGAGLTYPFTTTAIGTVQGLAYASVGTVQGLAKASVGTIQGLA